MTSTIPTKKLFKIAIFTSILIGVLSIAPHAIMHPVSLAESFKIGFLLTLIIFIIWLINIALVYLTEKYFKNKFSVRTRYILSYIICIALVIFTLFTAQIVFASNLAVDGQKKSKVDEQIKVLEAQNTILKIEIAKESSLTSLVKKAKDLGFKNPEDILNI